jgi:hypothetical protein
MEAAWCDQAICDPARSYEVKKGLMVICYVSLKEHNRKAGVEFINRIQN